MEITKQVLLLNTGSGTDSSLFIMAPLVKRERDQHMAILLLLLLLLLPLLLLQSSIGPIRVKQIA
jgi:hypothetical protein